MPGLNGQDYRVLMFQSAPGLEAGRCICAHVTYLFVHMFQSAPGLEAGRCPLARFPGVKIPSFNPRPALRPGDAPHLAHGWHVTDLVSIRARP